MYKSSDTLIVANRGVLYNDIKMLQDKDPLQRLLKKEAIPTIPPQNGSIFLNRNGSFLYKNNQPLAKKDSFAYVLIPFPRIKVSQRFSITCSAKNTSILPIPSRPLDEKNSFVSLIAKGKTSSASELISGPKLTGLEKPPFTIST